MAQSPDSILSRLEELRKWQEEQQQILLEKQVSQRELLNLEQQKLYEMLGLSVSRLHDSSIHQSDTEEHIESIEKDNGITPIVYSDCEIDEGTTETNTANQFINTNNHKQQIRLQDQSEVPNKGITKTKTYLRRGEGLTSRFKVPPDIFRLDNLPKYKYANAHKKSKFFPKERLAKSKPIKKPILPTELRLSKPRAKLELVQHQVKPDKNTRNIVDNNSETTKMLPEVQQVAEKQLGKMVIDNSITDSETSCTNIQTPITWAKVLDPMAIRPTLVNNIRSNTSLQDTPTREKVRQQQKEIDELNVFELIEKNVNEQSFASNDSVVQLLQSNSNPNDPLVDIQDVNEPIQRFDFNINKQINLNPESDSEEEESEENESENETYENARGRVRFADHVVINDTEIMSESETILSTDIDDMDLSKTSTPNDKAAFETFKSKLFGNRLIENSQNSFDTTVTNEDVDLVDQQIDLQTKTDLLKQRLIDLEKEIDMFRNQNALLTKIKQDHELLKLELEQEGIEMNEKLNDERIKLEVYLHDERIKIAEERAHLEKRAKELRAPNRKDREIVTKLKEQVAELQKEAASKDQKHVAAQARLRAQIRNMEKDLKDYSFEIDNLRKENKKIEAENIRLRRQGNNKLLNEINKNIAKLAPPKTPTNEHQPKTFGIKTFKQPIVAKVISHGNTSDRVKNIRSASIPNLSEAQEISEENSSDTESSCSSNEEPSSYFNIDKNKNKENHSSENLKTIETHDQPNLPITNIAKSLKREILNKNGSKDIWYPNGNLKKISADAMVIQMLYYNKDIKETNIGEGTVKYYYAETNTWHTSYLDGLEILEFPNGQIEHRYKDGNIEVHFPNGSTRKANPNNVEITEEWKYPDGTTVVQKRDGDKLLTLPNGQREVHTKQHKRREYPDGTVKIVYPDGSQETRYSNGRVRLKDNTGKLVMDSENTFAAK